MALERSGLGKFVKQTRLVIASIEDVSSATTELFKLTLAEEVEAKGSNVTDTGAPLILRNVTEVMVTGEDYDKMLANASQEGDIIKYEGSLKLDVAKPRIKMVGDQAVVTKAAAAWLVSVTFDKRGNGLIKDKQAAFSSVLAELFGTGNAVNTAAPVKPGAGQGTKFPERQAVDTSKQTAKTN